VLLSIVVISLTQLLCLASALFCMEELKSMGVTIGETSLSVKILIICLCTFLPTLAGILVMTILHMLPVALSSPTLSN
jgi:hypothetical protein